MVFNPASAGLILFGAVPYDDSARGEREVTTSLRFVFHVHTKRA
jgi:hypothetical protein